MIAENEKLRRLRNNELIRKAVLDDDGRSFKKLITLYTPYFKKQCLGFTRSKEEAEDLYQEGLIKIWTGLKNYNPSKDFLPWAATIYRNSAISDIRKAKTRQRINGIRGIDLYKYIEARHPNPPSEEEKSELNSHMNNLSEKEKTVINMIYSRGHTLSEVAKLLDLPLGTIKSTLNRGLSSLRRSIGSLRENMRLEEITTQT